MMAGGCLIVRIKSIPDYAAQSFELDTIVDYLVKPFAFDRFLKAVNKAKDRIVRSNDTSESEDEIIYLNVDKTHHKLNLSHILYIESNRNYVSIVTKDHKLTFIDSLKNWKDKLAGKAFIQVHKSFIVNRKAIDKLAGNRVFVNGQPIPVGRSYKGELLRELNII